MDEIQFIYQLNLVGLEQLNSNKWICKCPLCKEGKSWNRPRIKRFGIFTGYQGNLMTKCLNCGYSEPFSLFLKDHFPDIYRNYISQSFLEQNKPVEPLFKKEKPKETLKIDYSYVLGFCQLVSSLGDNHPAINYLKGRRTPEKFYQELYYTSDFGQFCSLIHESNKEIIDFDFAKLSFPAILIPIFDEENRLVFIQARNLLKSNLRFITVKLDKFSKKIWGINKLDKFQTIYVFEGFFDAVFVNNSLAMLGSSVSDLPFDNNNDVVFILDNELNKKEINNIAVDIIKHNYKLLFWTLDNKFKDLNEMVLNNYFQRKSEIVNYIKTNAKSGFEAQIELNMRSERNKEPI